MTAEELIKVRQATIIFINLNLNLPYYLSRWISLLYLAMTTTL